MSTWKIPSIPIDPDAKLDYTLNWRDASNGGPYLEDGEDIATSDWIMPAEVTKIEDTNDTSTTTIWLHVTAGSVLQVYRVTNRITTTIQSPGGTARTEDRSLDLSVQER